MCPRSAKRPRRKAKQERARETVRALLDAAARVLEQRGYAGATTNRIAEAAGASVGTLYEYFADKEAVYDALIEREISTLVAAIRTEHLDPRAPIQETLRRVLEVAIGALPRGPDFIRSLEQVPGAVFRKRLADARQLVIGFVRQLLEAHRDELRVDDLDLAAFVVVSTAEGIGSNASKERFDERLAEEIGRLLGAYLTGAQERGAHIEIVSGGQTGVDLAALEVAERLGLARGGWCPKGRANEDGRIPERFPLRETETEDVAERTRRNVQESDGVLVLRSRQGEDPGTSLAIETAIAEGKPVLRIVRGEHADPAERLRSFLARYRIARLNVAGPRASQDAGAHAFATAVLEEALGDR